MNNIFIKGFYLVYLIIGGIWLRSSIGKIMGGKFVDSLGETLTKVRDKAKITAESWPSFPPPVTLAEK